MCKGIEGTGKVLVLDSGFCVLKALTKLKKRGIYAHVVIKKHKYWPHYIFGDEIDKHMKDSQVGDVDVATGTLDDVPYKVFCMKEPDYVMKLMSTYGDLSIPEQQEDTIRIYEKDGKDV